jgi:hypothetical protein
MNESDAPLMVLAQVHDALLYQVRIGQESVISEVEKLLSFPVEFPSGKYMTVPVETQVGYNWAKEAPDNPHGLSKKLEDLKNKKLIITPLG